MSGGAERGLWLDTAHQADLATFVERAQRLDDAAVIRLRQRSDGLLAAWTATGFDVLASRVVHGRVRPADVCVAADALARGLAAMGSAGRVDIGFPVDSAWRGALPPETGFVHLDDVPAAVLRGLAQRGAELSREQGAAGPPASLLDQEVVRVSGQSAGPDGSVGIPMRCVFALTAMGFIPAEESDAIVRVRVLPAWLRIDARFGTVYRRRGDPLLLM
jgi:hypothetical protein